MYNVALAVNVKSMKGMLKTYFKGEDIVVSFNTDGSISIYCNPETCKGLEYHDIAGIQFEGIPSEYMSRKNEYHYHHAKSVAETIRSVFKVNNI